MRMIYGVCSWGLGHATRSLPVIRKLVSEGNELTIIATGRSLSLLKEEVGEGAEYIDFPDYFPPQTTNPDLFFALLLLNIPEFFRSMYRERKLVANLVSKKKYDMILSDNRYGIYDRKLPSFFFTHQLKIMNPYRLRRLESGTEFYTLYFLRRFYAVMVPDYREDDLSGELSHGLRFIDEDKIESGALSDFERTKGNEDIDYFISISGPEPHRTSLEKRIEEQVRELGGKAVVSLGKAGESKVVSERDGITYYSFLDKDDRTALLNRSKLVISRSGYSTLMDLAVLGKKALFIPTPGQPEQEYLGEYHKQKKTFFSVTQEELNVRRDVGIAEGYKGVGRECDVRKSVERVMDVIHSSKGSRFL